jgi:hypothetical protein
MQMLDQRRCEALEANSADLQDQITALADLNSDDVLTPAKKPQWIFMNSVLTAEQSALDTEATTYGITTEKTNYDNAISTLATYLAGLTTPVAWDNLTGNTNIVGTTFRSKFNDVLVKKQALLNKMHDTAKTLANTAQTTADTVKLNHAINTGYPAPADILTASDAGSSATVSVAAHSRVYGDISSVSVNSGSITGLAYSTDYFVYYDQSSRAGGTVTYVADTNANHAMPTKAAGRHYCGKVTTPAAGGGSTTGGSTPPSGGSGISQSDIHSTL